MTNLSDLNNKSGLYIVFLKNHELLSVNSQDKRRANKCIKVNHLNCKFGKAKNLLTRKKNYFKTFGEENVIYTPVATLDQIDISEKLILKELNEYRLRGLTGRRNEWLEKISNEELIQIIFQTLVKNSIDHISLIQINLK